MLKALLPCGYYLLAGFHNLNVPAIFRTMCLLYNLADSTDYWSNKQSRNLSKTDKSKKSEKNIIVITALAYIYHCIFMCDMKGLFISICTGNQHLISISWSWLIAFLIINFTFYPNWQRFTDDVSKWRDGTQTGITTLKH